MKYTIINGTTQFKTPTLRRIINFATRGMGPYIEKPFEIEVNDLYYRVRADKTFEYDEESLWGGEAIGCEKVFVFINPKIVFPLHLESDWTPRTKYIDGQTILNKKELLLFLVSHEVTHILQEYFKDPIIASNIINLDEESQCDIVAMITLNKWRRKLEKERAAKKNRR